eukprot:CAMPEP_0172386534 /NCGR_PEP_ID=MMETSP1061-20121228/4041_1 /TAXON_ID=37318 /ORGANISM="Pseudo-nitzschia pungens, Strain cf. pungens" /LENGTH=92 /DNA_ID=CAMNT_0013115921 /DNA_START=216 /DNA_END=494 /DNA_ORIENTATION=-
MGNASSKSDSNNSDSNSNNSDNEAAPVCLDCDKKHQKDLPADDPVSQTGQPCASSYEAVTACMSRHEGQISSCAREWEAFRECHQKEQQQQQ